jgi:hypothetical protein
VTDQSTSHSPAEEPDGDVPAGLVPDESPTEVRAPDSPAPAPPPPPAFAPAGATASPPPVATASPPPVAPPPPITELPSGDTASAGPGGLAAAFPPDRPERAVGAAFGGGLVLALILKRLAR